MPENIPDLANKIQVEDREAFSLHSRKYCWGWAATEMGDNDMSDLHYVLLNDVTPMTFICCCESAFVCLCVTLCPPEHIVCLHVQCVYLCVVVCDTLCEVCIAPDMLRTLRSYSTPCVVNTCS